MIATATTGKGFKGVISYVQKEHEKDLSEEEKPELIAKNHIYGDTKKMSSQMRFLAKENSRVSRPVLHVAVSFHKSEKLTAEEAEKAVNSVLKEIGVDKENNQYLLMKHNDAKHEHYHAVVNKVGLDGKNIDTSYIKNRLQVACDKVEQEQSLRRTEGRTILYDPTNERGYRFLTKEEKAAAAAKKREAPIRDKGTKIAEEKNHIKTKITEALKDRNIDTAEKLKTALEKESIQTKFMENKNGISGVSFRYHNQAYKGTDLGYRWKQVSNGLEQNKKSLQQMKTKEQSVYSTNKEDWKGIDKTNPNNFPVDYSKFTNEQQKEIMFTKDYNKAIENVVNQHREEYKKENLTPDTDRIFKENGFKKEGERFVFEKDGHKQEVQKKAFDVATKQVQERHQRFEKESEKYNTLMSTQPEKVPLIFGREKIIEQNEQLAGRKILAQKPVFNVDNSTLDIRTYQINSKSVKDKLNDINKENFKSVVEKGRDEKGAEKTSLTIAKEEKKNKGLGM